MKAALYAIRSFGRELRSGEVIVLLAAVALAVAALTAVGFLTDRIGRAVERQANEILAADLRLRSPDPVPAEWPELAAEFDLQLIDDSVIRSFIFNGPILPPGTWLDPSRRYSNDGLHPNKLGNKHFANVVSRALVKLYGDSILR